MDITKEDVIEALKEVHDPEIGIDIVNLGLVYDIDITDTEINVKMTLTAPGCPLSQSIGTYVKNVLSVLDITRRVNLEIVWEPRWTPARMSDEAKRELGYI
ncbi:MAG: metal-sulfur cluster assembly factor [Candidatus Kryptoniota bacterium]